MSKVTLTPVQRKAFTEIVATGTSKAAEATIKALVRRNLVELDGDGFKITKAGQAFLKLDREAKTAKAVADKPKQVEQKPEGETVRETVAKVTKKDLDPATAKEVAEAVNPIAASRTDKVVKAEQAAELAAKRPTATDKPKAAPVDKDSTIRLSKQILTYLATRKPLIPAELDAKIAKATVAKDESKRIDVTDADLDALTGYAQDMAKAEGASRGDVRSANALVSWIAGMKARRATTKK